MRRGSRIATSVAAAGVLVTGAGAALAALPASGHAHPTTAGQATRSSTAESSVVVDRLKAQAVADQKQADALSRAIGRARTRLTAAQRAIATEQAAQARAAQRSAAAARAAVAASELGASSGYSTSTGSYQPATTQRYEPAPAPSSSAGKPPPVATTTGASGAGGTKSGEPSEAGDGGESGSDD